MGQVGRARAFLVASGGPGGCPGLGRVPPAQFLKLERLHFTPCAHLQVWPDELTLTFGGAEARCWRRQGGAGEPGSPRPRPHPSNTPSSPPPPHILTCALASAQIKGLAALCATAEVKERYLILTGAAVQPVATGRPHSRQKTCVLLLACMWLLARGQISKSARWSKRGKPPRVCLPYDSMSAWEALGAVAGVARASGSAPSRRQRLAQIASYTRYSAASLLESD